MKFFFQTVLVTMETSQTSTTHRRRINISNSKNMHFKAKYEFQMILFLKALEKYFISQDIMMSCKSFYAPPPESGGVLCYTLRNFECPSVRLSVCPSVRPSAPTTILVSATPPTVLGQSFWNFTGVLRMVWRYAYCFFRILKLFFITFFAFLT